MKTIIFFTNQESLAKYVRYEMSKGVDETEVASVIPVNEKKQFIVVYDKIDQTAFGKLLSQVPAGDCFFIHHSVEFEREKLLEDLSLQNVSCPFRHQMRTNHADRKTYWRIIDIEEYLGQPEKLEEIFDELIKRIIFSQDHSEKVNALHKCLDPSQAPEVTVVDDRLSDTLHDLKMAASAADGLFDPDYRLQLKHTVRQWLSA